MEDFSTLQNGRFFSFSKRKIFQLLKMEDFSTLKVERFWLLKWKIFSLYSNAKNHNCNTPKIFLAFKLKDLPALTLLEPHVTSAIEFEMEDFAICKASFPYPSLVRRKSMLFRLEKERTKRRFSVAKVFTPRCRKNCSSHRSLSSFWPKLQQKVGQWVHFRQQQSGHPEVCSETMCSWEPF